MSPVCETNHRLVAPGQVIGILGGGQLGRMIALEARRMGYRIATLDPVADGPCGQVSDAQVVAPYTDVDAARRLAAMSDVVTYEFENVSGHVAEALEGQGCLPQGGRLLRITQNRLREKDAIQSCGLPVAKFTAVSSLDDLLQATDEIGFPCVLKTTQGGYDGKGQWKLNHGQDANMAWREYEASAQTGSNPFESGQETAPLILERFILFERELSVVVARNQRGQIACFPVAENVHRHHILHHSIVPARVDEDVRRRAIMMAEQLAAALKLVGLLAVEMFLAADGTLYVNELAPRPHNSGHYTSDACATSQFEQHVRAVCGMPLGDTRLLSSVVMVNILGGHVDAIMNRMADWPPNMKLHLYGKAEAKPGRKMGHVNILSNGVQDALRQMDLFGVWGVQNDEEEMA